MVSVSDGDTLTVLDSEKKQHKVRVNGIDAHEKGQAISDRSRQNLAQMAHGKDARIKCHKTDRFGREERGGARHLSSRVRRNFTAAANSRRLA